MGKNMTRRPAACSSTASYRRIQAREVTRTDQQLERDLANMGLRIENVEGDGNCMFRAVAAQLRGSEERHGEIRAATVAYIRSNRADFEPVTVESFGEGFDEYCDFMERPGSWGGEPELPAMAAALNVCLTVYSPGLPPMVYTPPTGRARKQVLLSFHGGNHYNVVRPARAVPRTAGPTVEANDRRVQVPLAVLLDRSKAKPAERKRGSRSGRK